MRLTTRKLKTLKPRDLTGLAEKIREGALAVIPTDTIYGIVTSANIPKSVEKIYKLRKRTSNKPMIILISSVGEIVNFGIKLKPSEINLLSSLWPNPISVVIDCKSKKFHFLHRGKNSLALRIPNNDFLQNLLKITGPIVAPSANFEGETPAKNIEQAKKYFKDRVSFYVDSGNLETAPSTVVKLKNSKLEILREGALKIPKQFLS